MGGGFAGLASAIAFRQNGHDVLVFEKTAGPSSAGGAICLAPNALACLSILGVPLYGMSKAGSYFAAPRIAALDSARNWALRLIPDPLFGSMAGSVSHWRPAPTPVTQQNPA